MGNRNVYGLLAKYPEAGKVKTRLAVDLGAEGARDVYKRIAELVFINTAPIKGSDFERVIFYSPSGTKGRFKQWLPAKKLILQRGGEIGEIMRNAIEDLFDSGAARAVLTGADIPGINRDVIEDAFSRLEDTDVVIGPAKDGGYYLIGMNTPHPEFFEGVSWSTEKVYEETVRIIARSGLSYSAVRTLSDVDRKEDFAGMRGLISETLI